MVRDESQSALRPLGNIILLCDGAATNAWQIAPAAHQENNRPGLCEVSCSQIPARAPAASGMHCDRRESLECVALQTSYVEALLRRCGSSASDRPRPRILRTAARRGPLPVPTGWTYRFTPYGWLTALNGRQTIRGRSFKVNATFVDIVEKSDTLVALMGDFEAKNGPVTLYADLVWSNIGADRSNVKTRGLSPGSRSTTARSLDLDIDMAIAEAGAFYEIGRYGPVAFELLAGARYWYQEASLSFDAVRSVEIADLEFNGARAFAKSGSVEWLDPLVGARVR